MKIIETITFSFDSEEQQKRFHERLSGSDGPLTPERRALLWVFDRLTTDNLTSKEIKVTADEVGNVLLGRLSRASIYEPNYWNDSAKLT